jgi:ABC-type Fe3+-hydroxamate transport system substrate-binding protein
MDYPSMGRGRFIENLKNTGLDVFIYFTPFPSSKMFPTEKADNARRILAAIAIACKHSPSFYLTIVNTNVIDPEPNPILNPDIIVIDDDDDDDEPMVEENLEKFLRNNCKDASRCFLDVLTDILNDISFSVSTVIL